MKTCVNIIRNQYSRLNKNCFSHRHSSRLGYYGSSPGSPWRTTAAFAVVEYKCCKAIRRKPRRTYRGF